MSPGLLQTQFLFDSAPFPSCHAPTLVQTGQEKGQEKGQGLTAAFFGGSREGKPDVRIWQCSYRSGKWSAPEPVADGIGADGIGADGLGTGASQLACWNPVLFRSRSGGQLTLFYKVGRSPGSWWGMVKSSPDGQHWGPATRLPPGVLGPAKNKPVELASGIIVSPCSVEDPVHGWQVYFERSEDGGANWTATSPAPRGAVPKAIQPTILVHSPTNLQAICRTTVGRLAQTHSRDAGKTWDALELMDLPNCNSGIDAVTLADGRHLLVYNHSNQEKVRYPLNVALSQDGQTWQAALELETDPPGQYSYPAVIQTSDGLVHILYTFKRKTIKHAIVDPNRLDPGPIDRFVCPPPGSPTHRRDEDQ